METYKIMKRDMKIAQMSLTFDPSDAELASDTNGAAIPSAFRTTRDETARVGPNSIVLPEDPMNVEVRHTSNS